MTNDDFKQILMLVVSEESDNKGGVESDFQKEIQTSEITQSSEKDINNNTSQQKIVKNFNTCPSEESLYTNVKKDVTGKDYMDVFGKPLKEIEEWEITTEGIKIFESNSRCFRWSVFFSVADFLFKEGRRIDDATFYLYTANMRGQVGAFFGEPGGTQTEFSAMSIIMGGAGELYLGEKRKRLIEILERVKVWDLANPYTQEIENLEKGVSDVQWQEQYKTVRDDFDEYINFLKDDKAVESQMKVQDINNEILRATSPFLNLTVFSDIYFDSHHNSFRGFCMDPKALEFLKNATYPDSKGSYAYLCNDSAKSWFATVPLSNGMSYCADSNRYVDLIGNVELGSATVCPGYVTVTDAYLNGDYKPESDYFAQQALRSMRSQAEIYYQTNLRSYSGFCDVQDVVTVLEVVDQAVNSSSLHYGCFDSKTNWAVSLPLTTEEYMCKDSTGSSNISTSTLSSTQCP
jgi:hypothetical protein